MDETPPQLIQAAFEVARGSGKLDWHRMTLPVLKNRLLTLTDRTFRETEFGVGTFRDFVRLAAGTVRLDESVYPAEAVLLAGEAHTATRVQVRSDLWRAVMDYSSGAKFVWDATEGAARVALLSDDDSLPVIPTISEEELGALRKSFADRYAPTMTPSLGERLRTWQAKGLPSKFIPRGLLKDWNQTLKSHVSERLHSWFEASDIPEPADLLRPIAVAKSRAGEPGLNDLRSLVIDCVNAMSEEELMELKLPPAAVLRICRQHG
ncbi:MAG TPA: hypothetical protein VOA87_16180 [Thermoanaerobaculia bacterium]|nr:hypothetical protein [Thermoanaerobaculia bacterium]